MQSLSSCVRFVHPLTHFIILARLDGCDSTSIDLMKPFVQYTVVSSSMFRRQRNAVPRLPSHCPRKDGRDHKSRLSHVFYCNVPVVSLDWLYRLRRASRSQRQPSFCLARRIGAPPSMRSNCEKQMAAKQTDLSNNNDNLHPTCFDAE